MICPHCGRRIYSLSPKWEKQVHALLSEMELRDKHKVWNSKQVEALALELSIAQNTFEAFRIWEEIRKAGLLEGIDPEIRYRWWRIKCGESQVDG